MSQLKKILIVDDEPEVISKLSESMTEAGFEVESYTDFDEALAYVKSKGKSFDAYLVDMKSIKTFDKNNLTEAQERVLKLPKKIFYELESQGKKDLFYFMSRNKSSHDQKVLEETDTEGNFVFKIHLYEDPKGALKKEDNF